VDAEKLYAEVAQLFLEAHTGDGGTRLLAFVGDHWSDIAARPANPHDAEVCRLAMLAAAHAQDFGPVRLWRSRALARFSAIGWVEGVGSIIIGEAFVELARKNNDYTAGRTLDVIKSSDVALGVLAELERFTVGSGSGCRLGPGSPSQAVLKRLLHEKRGFLLLLSGDYDAARESYSRALEAAGTNRRGQVKVQLGRLLVDYLDAEDAQQHGHIAEETARLGREASEASSPDVAETAEVNAKVMREGGQALAPYEIL
jgi:hypothetical protein